MNIIFNYNRRELVGNERAPRGDSVKHQLGKAGEPLTKRDYEMEKQREVEELKRFREEMVRSVDEQREDARKQFENEVRKSLGWLRESCHGQN